MKCLHLWWEYIMNKHRIKDDIPICVIRHHNEVHEIDNELRMKHGDAYYAISRDYIYKEIQKITGYSTRTIAEILNHTKKIEC